MWESPVYGTHPSTPIFFTRRGKIIHAGKRVTTATKDDEEQKRTTYGHWSPRGRTELQRRLECFQTWLRMIDGKDEERGRKIACNWGWRRGDEKRRASKVGLLLTSGFGRTLLLEGHWLANRFRPVRQPMRANHATCQAIRRGPQAAPWKNMEVLRPSSSEVSSYQLL